MDDDFEIVGRWERVETEIPACQMEEECLTFESGGWVTCRGVVPGGERYECRMTWKIEGSNYCFSSEGRAIWTGHIENDGERRIVLRPKHGFKSVFQRTESCGLGDGD